MADVIVIGGGLAGLAAAAALGSVGHSVRLLEARPFLGGRATSYEVGSPESSETIDNCQHVLLRCCVNLLDFYKRLGFTLLRDGGDFVELTWEDHRLYLAELSAYHLDSATELPLPPAFPLANVRVMVPDVDQCWRRAIDLGARIITAIDDRYYGLREFIITDLDGFGVRFASRLKA